MFRRQAAARVPGARKHLAVYPVGPAAVDAVHDQLSGASLSEGTVRFTVEAPLPERAIRELARARRDEIAGA